MTDDDRTATVSSNIDIFLFSKLLLLAFLHFELYLFILLICLFHKVKTTEYSEQA